MSEAATPATPVPERALGRSRPASAGAHPPRRWQRWQRWIAWIRSHRVWVLVTFAYLSVFPYSPAINNPNENVRIYMTRALVEHHTLAINQVEADWGWVNDKAKNDTRLFSSKAPGTSLLGVPVLAVETWLWHRLGWPSPSKLATTLGLRVFAVMVPMCAFLLVFSSYARRVSRSRGMGDLLLVGVGLGSLIYPYGIHFVGHGLAAALSFGAFMALAPRGTIRPAREADVLEADAREARDDPGEGEGRGSARRALLAGLLAGLGVVFEYQNILVAALLGIYVAVRRPRLLVPFLVGALPAAVLLGAIHTLCFGRPWAFPYGHLENLEFQTAHHHSGFYGVVGPARAAILGVLFLPGFGFFACSPFLVLATLAVGASIVRGPRAEGILIAAVAVVLTLFVAGLPNWRGGWSVGPRYITAVVPFLAMGLAYAWPTIASSAGSSAGAARARVAWGLAAGLVLVGIFTNALTAVIYPQVPPQLRNPTFQLLLRLPLDGYVPYSLGYGLGLRGLASLAPTALALAAAAGLALVPDPLGRSGGGRWRPWRSVTTMVVVFAVLIGVASRWPAHPSAAEVEAVRTVERAFSPPPSPGPSNPRSWPNP